MSIDDDDLDDLPGSNLEEQDDIDSGDLGADEDPFQTSDEDPDDLDDLDGSEGDANEDMEYGDEGDDSDRMDAADDESESEDEDAADEHGAVSEYPEAGSESLDQKTIQDLQDQLDAARQDNQKLVSKQVAADLEVVVGQVAALQKSLETAIEDEDAGVQAETQVKLSELSTRKMQLESQKDAAENAPALSPARQAPMVSRYPKANEYLQVNPWVGDPRYVEQTKVFKAVDTALFAEGYSPNDDAYYKELSKRLGKRFPGLMKSPKGGKLESSKTPVKKQTKPIISADRGKRTKKASKRRALTLTADERANMSKFGMDPRDPTHRAMYIKNRNERERNEG